MQESLLQLPAQDRYQRTNTLSDDASPFKEFEFRQETIPPKTKPLRNQPLKSNHSINDNFVQNNGSS